MRELFLRCRKCGSEYPMQNIYLCNACQGILEVQYNYSAVTQDSIMHHSHVRGIWRFHSFLPVLHDNNKVSLGEGDTPLIIADNLAPLNSCCSIFLKLESLNPSGSFKDRPVAVGVSKAKEFGAKGVLIASSGNASASAAAYAARVGMRCVVCIPQSTDIGKVSQAVSHGAEVVYVEGTFSNSFEIAKTASQYCGWPNVSTTFINPYTVEGDKTLAYEIYLQLNCVVPDIVIVPVGAGPLLVGMAKGFAELKYLNLTKKIPRMVGVQSTQCAPIAEAYDQHIEQVQPWLKPIKTVATGIADPLVGYEDDGSLTLKTIIETGGIAIALSEEEILAANRKLHVQVGVYAEPTAAVAIGALERLAEVNLIGESETVVCIITGHGLKYNSNIAYRPPVVSGFDEFVKMIKFDS